MAGHTSYEVMVRVLAMNGAAPILRQIAADVLGLGHKVDAIGAKFGKWKLALAGVSAGILGVGVAAWKAEMALARMGDKVVRQQQIMRAGGMTDMQVASATKLAYRMAATTPGVSAEHGLQYIGELRAALGSYEHAANTAPEIAKMATALRNSGFKGFTSEQDLTNLFKALDLFGAGMRNNKFDPKAYGEGLKALTQVEFATHGMLPPSMLLQIARMGGFTGQEGKFTDFLQKNLSSFLQLGSRHYRRKRRI